MGAVAKLVGNEESGSNYSWLDIGGDFGGLILVAI
jgi:hypothetical protein